MTPLEAAYVHGQRAALARYKLAFPVATHPAVRRSAVNTGQAGKPAQVPAPAVDPATVAQTFNASEQAETRIEPLRKLSADICTTCRKPRHYGSCKRPVPIKQAGFNLGMKGEEASVGDVEGPSVSPHYSSATSAVSALAQAPEGRPASEQAASAFAQFLRPARDLAMSDQPDQASGSLAKVSEALTMRTPPRSAGDGLLSDASSDRAWQSFDHGGDAAADLDPGINGPVGGPIA